MALSNSNTNPVRSVTNAAKQQVSNALNSPISGTNPVSSVTDAAQQKLNNVINSGKEKIDAVQQKVNDVQDKVNQALEDISGAVQDPFGTIIKKSLNKINSLIVNVEKKLDQLVKNVIEKTDSKGRVKLEGSTLIITVTREDVKKAEEIKKNVTDKIASINATLTILRSSINTLSTIQQSINTYKTVLDVQEMLLSLNPATGPIFLVLKKGIKIVFLKEIIGEYLKLIGSELAKNKEVVNRLILKFRSLQVSVKIKDEEDKGNFIDQTSAEGMLIGELMGEGVDKVAETFTDQNSIKYILKVEKYDSKQLIARAYEEKSGLIKAQTAPSYFSGPDELLQEIKSILNEI